MSDSMLGTERGAADLPKPDLLDWVLKNRFMRNVLAALILLKSADAIYDSCQDFARGFRKGYAAAAERRR